MASAILVTPKGPAEWVKLFTFDTKFNPLGLYTINLKLKEDEAEDLTVRLTQQVDAVYASELKKNPMAVVEQGDGFPVAVLNQHNPQ